MAAWSPSSSSSNDSRESTPVDFDRLPAPKVASTNHLSESDAQDSAFLKLPVDIFKCVTDYLDRDAAWCLKRLCRGMSRSNIVDQILYKYPIQWNDVRDIRLAEWKYRAMGRQRWVSFQRSINDSNRHLVQRLAMSHWCSIADFKWIEENLTALTSLELTAIKDFVWTPEEIWTWKELAEACPKLFERIDELEVCNWADYNAHSRIEYSYSYNDYRFKEKFRLCRRRDGGSVATMIFPLCTQLKTLAIRERFSGFHIWNEWEVHQRVCCLVDGVQKYCPSTLKKLRVYDYSPFRSLFSTDASDWHNIDDIEIGLYSWMEDRRERDVISPIPYRIQAGHHHRDAEEDFDDKTFDQCERNHMDVGQHVVQGVSGATFEDLLQSLRTITQKYPHANVKPISTLRDMVLHPFHLVNVTTQRRGAHLAPPPLPTHAHAAAQAVQANAAPIQPEPLANQEIRDSIRWLAQKCDWRPVLAWDSMMCDVFPENLEPTRSLLPKQDVISRIRTMVQTLKSLDVPIRISIGDRTNSCPSSGLDGSLYFGDFKCIIGEGENKRELMAATQARFNLSGIAPLVDELTIQYAVDVPGVSGWRSNKHPTEAEKELVRKEMRGWRRFWTRYAGQFKNLKKLSVTVPSDIYNDWGKSAPMVKLLESERWEMLEDDERSAVDVSFFEGYLPFNLIRATSLAKKRPRMKFVQRVFFRQDQAELELDEVEMTDEEREGREIGDADIATKEVPPHRFWPAKAPKVEKRKAESELRDELVTKRIKAD